MFPTEMVFESTAGDRIGVAVQRLNHSATLSLFIDKSQKMFSILNLFFFALPNLSNIFELECAHICLLFFRSFFEPGVF